MNTGLRYTLIALGVILAALTLWYFIHIVAYILISAVLALVGRPVVEFLGKLRIGRLNIPKAIRAAVALLLMWLVLGAFLRIFVPLLSDEVNNLSNLDTQTLLESLQEPIHTLEHLVQKYKISGFENFTVQNFLTEKAMTIFNAEFFQSIFGSIAALLGNIFIAFFSISFITFFFLRDERLFVAGVLILVPDKHEDAFKHAMHSTRQLLMRYFIGILGQITGIFILLTIGLTLAGVGFTHSLLIAIIAGLLNVIPYVGPFIGAAIGVIMGVTAHLDMDYYTQLMPLVGWIIVVFIGVQLVDNFVFQPFIFSSSVNAHPLEIFILLLVAGSLAGVGGMILAIPCYTVVRVFAKEFFNKFKVVKKLTKNID